MAGRCKPVLRGLLHRWPPSTGNSSVPDLGGALRMTAGAMRGWMFDVVVSVDLMTLAGDLLMTACERELTQIDEKLFLELFQDRTNTRGSKRRSKARPWRSPRPWWAM